MPKTIVCPSGLAGSVRGFKVKEANLLADRGAMKSGTAFDQILDACWLSTSDLGPYAVEDGKKLRWEDALVCDRLFAMIQVRCQAYGPDYAFDVQCQSASCGEKIRWILDLEKDLPVKPLPESSRAAFRAGNRFTTTMVDSEDNAREVTFQLLTGKGEREAARILKKSPSRLVVAALGARIVSIEGVDANEKSLFLGNQEIRVLGDMMTAFDEVDGGIETTIEVECQQCGNRQDVELPLGGEFYLPKARSLSTTSTL